MSEAEAEAARLIRVVPNGDGWNVEHVDGAVEAFASRGRAPGR
jgi:hypothetical protein